MVTEIVPSIVTRYASDFRTCVARLQKGTDKLPVLNNGDDLPVLRSEEEKRAEIRRQDMIIKWNGLLAELQRCGMSHYVDEVTGRTFSITRNYNTEDPKSVATDGALKEIGWIEANGQKYQFAKETIQDGEDVEFFFRFVVYILTGYLADREMEEIKDAYVKN